MTNVIMVAIRGIIWVAIYHPAPWYHKLKLFSQEKTTKSFSWGKFIQIFFKDMKINQTVAEDRQMWKTMLHGEQKQGRRTLK